MCLRMLSKCQPYFPGLNVWKVINYNKTLHTKTVTTTAQQMLHFDLEKPSDQRIPFTMMTSSNGNIFRVTGPLCGEFTGPGEFPTQRPVTRSFDVLFDLRLNKRLSKQPWGWWFEPPSWSLWRHRNERTGDTGSVPKPWGHHTYCENGALINL